MPFTASHPAIILPLIYLPGKWISLTGLVIGSMTPDFEYFERMSVQSDYSYSQLRACYAKAWDAAGRHVYS
jgi:hypothetical protein